MNKQLALLIMEYSSNNKKADELFIKRALDIILKNDITKNMEINISEKSRYNNRGLLYATKYEYSDEFLVYIDDMTKLLSEEYKIWLQIISLNPIKDIREKEINKSMLYQYNLTIVKMLIYQSESIKQYNNYSKLNTLEGILCDLSSKIDIRYAYLRDKNLGENKVQPNGLNIDLNDNNFDKLYQRYKKINQDYRFLLDFRHLKYIEPHTRFAHINSLYRIQCIINELNLNNNVKNLLHFINNYYRLYFLFINCYHSTSLSLNPIGRYTSLLRYLDEYSTENLSSIELDRIFNQANNSLNLEERIHYGLGITSYEYNEACSGKVKILKSQR